ncbi:MAG TPA: hypothetical protein VGD68_15850 [Streptosporangiaceae bacterium]
MTRPVPDTRAPRHVAATERKAASPGPRGPWAVRARRLAEPGGTVLAAVILFGCYYLQSRTVPIRSDGGSVALQAWDMLHGDVLLRHWHMSDVSFWPAELVQYALLEAVDGLGPGVIHLGGAMTYTLLLLLAAYLARGPGNRAAGRDAPARVAVVVAIMVAPAAVESPTLLLTPDHLGSAVPVLLAWLAVDRLADRPGARWYLPVLVALVLAWGQVADGLVLLTGALPMAVACGARACVRLRPRAAGSGTTAFPWLEAGLAGAAIVSAVLARGIEALIRVSGGYVLRPVATSITSWAELPHVVKLTAQGLAALFGVAFSRGQPATETVFAVLHLAGLAVALVAFVLALGRLGRAGDLMLPGLALGIAVNVAAYTATPYAQDLLSTREISAALPFAAVLAGRQLAGPMWRAARAWPAVAPALAVVLVAAPVALGYHASQPARPADNQKLASWLAAHHLTAGLSTDYWVANSTTLDAGGRVTVRQISINRRWQLVHPVTWGNRSDWYDAEHCSASFIVVDDARPGAWTAESWGAVHAFGRPVRTLHPDGYTVLIWRRNLLAGIR